MELKIFLIVCLFVLVVTLEEGEIDLRDYTWTLKFTFPSRGLNSKAIQGGGYFNGKFYQFHDKTGGLRIFDTTTYEQIGDIIPINIDSRLHHGSATFSDEFSYILNGTEVTTTIPLLYSSGHYDGKEIIDVLDIENDVIVRQYFFENRRDDITGAYDFENNRMWVIGYEKDGSAITPWTIDEYKFSEDRSTVEHVGDTVIIDIKNNTLQELQWTYLYNVWMGTIT